jgi:hypothetical protein
VTAPSSTPWYHTHTVGEARPSRHGHSEPELIRAPGNGPGRPILLGQVPEFAESRPNRSTHVPQEMTKWASSTWSSNKGPVVCAASSSSGNIISIPLRAANIPASFPRYPANVDPGLKSLTPVLETTYTLDKVFTASKAMRVPSAPNSIDARDSDVQVGVPTMNSTESSIHLWPIYSEGSRLAMSRGSRLVHSWPTEIHRQPVLRVACML